MRDYGCGITDAGLRMRDYGCGITDAGLRMRDYGGLCNEAWRGHALLAKYDSGSNS
jgi:hypothetical protein